MDKVNHSHTVDIHTQRSRLILDILTKSWHRMSYFLAKMNQNVRFINNVVSIWLDHARWSFSVKYTLCDHLLHHWWRYLTSVIARCPQKAQQCVDWTVCVRLMTSHAINKTAFWWCSYVKIMSKVVCVLIK